MYEYKVLRVYDVPGVYCWDCVKKIATEKGVGIFKAMEGFGGGD